MFNLELGKKPVVLIERDKTLFELFDVFTKEESLLNLWSVKTQAKMISATRKLLAQSLGLEVKKVVAQHDYKENTLIFNVEGETLNTEQQAKVDKAKDFIMSMLG